MRSQLLTYLDINIYTYINLNILTYRAWWRRPQIREILRADKRGAAKKKE